jgi:photosystem II stability/assembly factor-like uncharacterized protein
MSPVIARQTRAQSPCSRLIVLREVDVKLHISRMLRGILVGGAGLVMLGACDDDPTNPAPVEPELTVISPDTIGRQEAIRVVFSTPVTAQTAQDPANFVVTNQCTGLRVPGALRLVGDTLIFSPSQALAFLTPLAIRVQNIRTEAGATLPVTTFSLTTQRPPVTDISWQAINSPTNDDISGISFLSRDLGYITTDAGVVFRTTNGGEIFTARFKRVDIPVAFDIHAFAGATPNADTLYMVGLQQAGSVLLRALFRSTNGGLTFDTVRTVSAVLFTLSARRQPTGPVLALFGGQFTTSAVYRYDAGTGALQQSTGILSSSEHRLSDVSLSTNTQNAIATMSGTRTLTGQGFLLHSTDGGVSFTQVPSPTGTFAFRGSGFINATDALALGDSSTVVRVNTATGATTVLGAAAGIPQTVRNAVTGELTSYQFFKAYFPAASQVGWIVGRRTTTRPGEPSLTSGVILITRNGGTSWTQQAVAGQPEDGLGFPPLDRVHALANDFAVTGGADGFLAARTADAPPAATACAFQTP